MSADDLETLARIASTPIGRLRIRYFGRNWPGETIDKARLVAFTAHEGQLDKAERPYITHPARVAARLDAQGEDDVVIAAGWLHDTVEDTDVTLEDIRLMLGLDGHEVATIVEALTHRPHEPLVEYWARIRTDPRAVAVKLADLDDNTDPARLALLDADTRARLEDKYARARQALTH